MAIDADEVRSDADELLDAGAHDRLDTMRHSAAHIMAAAVLELFPEAKLGIGPAIRDGFYYDFDLPRALTPADLEAIEERMRAQVTANLPFERSELDREARPEPARERGPGLQGRDRARAAGGAGAVVSFYRHGAFNDLCRGPHVEATGGLGPFKLLNSAGAYWRGDEKRPMLQRIYGTVWESQDDLDRYLWRLEEAKKRDHRKLGRDLDLFTFHPESPAAPFWHPRGMAMWRALEDWSREVRRAGGFDEVRTPSLVRKELWETSGHWELYQDNMFVLDDHGHLSGLKPMNCPQEILIYKTQVALLPRAADPLRRLLGALPQGADRRAVGHVPGAAAGPGRLARLLPRRPGDRRDQPGAGPGAQAVRAVRRHAAASSWRRGRRSGWAPTSSGTWPRAS